MPTIYIIYGDKVLNKNIVFLNWYFVLAEK